VPPDNGVARFAVAVGWQLYRLGSRVKRRDSWGELRTAGPDQREDEQKACGEQESWFHGDAPQRVGRRQRSRTALSSQGVVCVEELTLVSAIFRGVSPVNLCGRMPCAMSKEITQLLLAWNQGDGQALNRLIPLVHGELHRLAHRYMAGERPGHPAPDHGARQRSVSATYRFEPGSLAESRTLLRRVGAADEAHPC
jgi:hypothetical protein